MWPLLLAFFWRNTRFFAAGFLLVLGASLVYSIMVVHHDVVADFYSPFTRFWELAIGAGVAYAVAERFAISDHQRTLIAWLGLCLIVLAVTLVQKSYLFPGAWALLPTLGAACLIYAGERAWPNRRVLSHRWLVWVGLISYPLYLWHWPLLSFARIMQSETPSVALRMTLLAASVLLAWLTYKLLERPVRARLAYFKRDSGVVPVHGRAGYGGLDNQEDGRRQIAPVIHVEWRSRHAHGGIRSGSVASRLRAGRG